MKTFYFLNHLNSSKLKALNGLTGEQFNECEKLAREKFNEIRGELKAEHGRLDFDSVNAFISSSDALNGFYFPSAQIIHRGSGKRLLLMGFSCLYSYNFLNHTKEFTPHPVAIFEDKNGDLFALCSHKLDRRPLNDRLKELNDYIKDYTAKAAACAAVEHVYKKDGKPFANIQKNFNNASIRANYDFNGALCCYEVKASSLWLTDVNGLPKDPAAHADFIFNAIKAAGQKYIALAENTRRQVEQLPAIYEEIMGELIRSILKYGTPANLECFEAKYLMFTLRDMLKNYYLDTSR